MPFVIKNEGSATFLYDWRYNNSSIKKFLVINIEPKSGHVVPGEKIKCLLSFTLKQVPVRDYPVCLTVRTYVDYFVFIFWDITLMEYMLHKYLHVTVIYIRRSKKTQKN